MSRMYVRGADEAIRKLRGLRKVEVKKAVRKGSRAGAKLIAARAREEAPERSGGLRKAIKVRALPRSRKWTGTQVTSKVADGPTYYGGFVELGTKRQKAQGYLKRAAQSTHAAAGAAFVAGIIEGIEAGVKRS